MKIWGRIALAPVVVSLLAAQAGAQSAGASRSAAGATAGTTGFTSTELKSGWEFRQHVAEGASQGPEAANVPSAGGNSSNRASADSNIPAPNTLAWHPATVPGDVHLDLLANKLIPDPFYRDNEAKLQWIENLDWEYRTTLNVDAKVLAHKNVELVFDGLDAYANVYINGKAALTADNMFRQWRIDAKPFLRRGSNELLVVFPSPIRQAAVIAQRDIWHQKEQIEDKVYIRKAAYEYGWDWGPRFVTSGIWRRVHLDTWDEARITNFHIRQRDITRENARLVAELEVTASAAAVARFDVDLTHAGKSVHLSQNAQLEPGENHLEIPFEIANPELWFPAGYGGQPLYRFSARLGVGGHTEDVAQARTGLRSVVLRREPDQWGRSFEFVINGIPVFGKGADVIPFDSFPNRVTTAQYRRILQSARDANMNMVRHWGGGYYETQEFYDICDELGILVWQDFMFGNDWQPGAYFWKQNVEKEIAYQVTRLREHPSIIIWCGNNETEEALGWKGRDRIDAETRKQMWQDYLTVFSGIIPRVVAKLAPETPYWPSSPSADYEETSDAYQTGDMHDWSVWHGRVPFSEYEKHFPRFMTEYGFQSFPEMRTIEAFTTPEDRTGIFTDVMLAHQKNNEGNSIIHDYMLRYYSEPKDFASFLYASQVLQAEGIKTGAEHLRRLRPRTMGSIFWQLNDCWPVASWSSIDYFGRWKALQFYAKRFYNDVLVSPHEENGAVAVYIVSDRLTDTPATLRTRLLTLDGKVLHESSQPVIISAASSKVYSQLPLSELLQTPGATSATSFLDTEVIADGKTLSSNLHFFVEPKLVALKPAKISATLSQEGGQTRLHLETNILARSVYVSFGDLDAYLSDNYFDLLPGSPQDIVVHSSASLEQLRGSMKVMSLADAFGPPQTAAASTSH